MKRLTSDNKMLEYGLMKAYSNISCFSTTRYGGYSKGNYASFNCNGYCGDELSDVERNRELLCKLLAREGMELVIPHQTHSDRVEIIDTDYVGGDEQSRMACLEGVDALATDIPGFCLCISTADCIPVLLYDSRNKVVAAVHAGWRGTVARITEKTLWAMSRRYGSQGKDLVACIGPGISEDAFEVGDEVYQAFYDAGFDMRFIARKKAKWHIDLWEANRLQLLACGVKPENVEVSGICTYYNNDVFFSARRQGIRSGRILSGIMLRS
ncbi:MAG: peptidoglycan editing factor PgeF [Phocaeicola sp.]|nr:peptidoglycan editing factor PgeF [Phocaeicola sp.]